MGQRNPKIRCLFVFFFFFLHIFLDILNFSGCFDTSGSLIALFVSKISPSGFFVTSTEEDEEEQLRILVVGFQMHKIPQITTVII